jgi:hypothetical protein
MATKSSPKITSAIDLFGKSYDIVMKNIKNFAILLALPFLTSVASMFSGGSAEQAKWENVNVLGGALPAYSIIGLVSFGLILFVLFAVAALIIQAMLMGLELEGAKGKTPSLKDLWVIGKKYWLRLFGLVLIIGLYFLIAAAAGSIILVPLLLLNLVPIGITLFVIWMLVSGAFIIQNYFMSPYVMLDQNESIFDSLSKSSKLVKGKARHIWSILGVMLALSLTGAVPFLGPLISFILGALYSVAPAIRYFELKKLS